MQHFLLILIFTGLVSGQSFIRVNLAGYLPGDIKNAVYISKDAPAPEYFTLHDALTGKEESKFTTVSPDAPFHQYRFTARLDFSSFTKSGAWYIKTGEFRSEVFRIGPDVYNGSTDILLSYMRQQQCGYNPFLNDSCHTNDGYIIYHPEKQFQELDVVGGWHDASDYLRYVTTSASVVYQMMFAYEKNRQVFSDIYDASGRPGKNGIPDIIDQAKWGINWLMKMNPAPGEYYNQIADDRDHRGFRLPNHDTVTYDREKGRPVYFINGEVQGLFAYKNRTEGKASSVAKFASAFAKASYILRDYYPELSEELYRRAKDAFEYAKANPGASQTAPGRAPYFYEEDNWADDMQLASVEMVKATSALNLPGAGSYLNDIEQYAEIEPVTPWMGADTANHYQWYPFINLAHYYHSGMVRGDKKEHANSRIREGIERIYQRGLKNPFRIGIPFIWCSNNLVSAAMTQMMLYRDLTGDLRYLETETALRDWLLGCNPWGVSMIIGLPEGARYPLDPHSSLAHLYNFKLTGGLVDGPVYQTIYDKQQWVKVVNGDEFASAQPGWIVYHDDYGDYVTNEPTHDGTAGLTYYFGQLEQEGNKNDIYYKGALIRGDTTKKEIALVFTGHEFADGYGTILKALQQYEVKASFFFTGDFYRNPKFAELIKNLKETGHYLGAHSDKHLLYCSWENRDSLLVTREQFIKDVADNYREMERFGITKTDAPYYLPPYEWYNDSIAVWTEYLGLKLVNHTPGTRSNQDWTIPIETGGSYYFSSDSIYASIMEYEKKSTLNGFHLLLHIGSDPRRTDKFYHRLDKLIVDLKKLGYGFGKMKNEK